MIDYKRFENAMIRSPPLQALTVFTLSLPLMLLFRTGSVMFAALGAAAFALASPLAGLRHANFWRYQFASLASQLVLLFVYLGICPIIDKNLREAGMVFLFPMMIPFGMFPLVIIIRLCTPLTPPPGEKKK